VAREVGTRTTETLTTKGTTTTGLFKEGMDSTTSTEAEEDRSSSSGAMAGTSMLRVGRTLKRRTDYVID
jgi:hypothetical protein